MNKITRNFFILLLLYFSALWCNAQIVYEKGYFVDNEGKRINCLIRNVEWLNNPVKFEFKLTENAERKTGVIDSVAEFGAEGSFRYLRRQVKIDTSSTNLRFISANRNPEYSEQLVFLKVLEEGEASLYMYRWGAGTRYFYSLKNNEEVNQLISKQYRNPQGALMTNDAYKQQLLFLTQCEAIKSSAVERVYFGEKDLMKLFRKYNHCGEDLSEGERNKGWEWHIGLRTGVSLAELELVNLVFSSTNIGLEKKYAPRYGLETELVFPFNKKKWAMALELTYLRFRSTAGPSNSYLLEGDFSYLNYILGVRHFFYLNKHSKLFVAPYLGTATSLSSKIDFIRANGETAFSIPVKSGVSFGAGAGYKFNDRISLEIRYMGPRSSFFALDSYNAVYNETNLTFGYNLF